MSLAALSLVDDEVAQEAVDIVPGAFIDIEISAMPGHKFVFCQPVAVTDALNSLGIEINRHYVEGPKGALKALSSVKMSAATRAYADEATRPNIFCAAPFQEDGCYYRALLRERVSASEAKVLFIDFGNEATAKLDEIYELTAEFRKAEAMTIRVELEEEIPGGVRLGAWATKALIDTAPVLGVTALVRAKPFTVVRGSVTLTKAGQGATSIAAFLETAAAERAKNKGTRRLGPGAMSDC